MPKQPKNNEKTDVAKKKAKKAPQKSTKSEKTAPEKPRLLFVLLESFLLNHAVPQIP